MNQKISMKKKILFIFILVVISTGAFLFIKHRNEGKIDPGIISDTWPDDVERPPITEEVTTGALPTFEKYLVEKEKFFVPAPLDLASNLIGAQFKTKISEGYTNQPNFAGKYTIVSWGCGTDCFGWVIVNNATGKIFGDYMTEKLLNGGSSYGISFDIKSNLLIINPSEVDDPEYFKNMDEHLKSFLRERKDLYPTRYFLWQEDELIPIDSKN